MPRFTYEVPLTVRFRGIEHRRGMVWRGLAGWGEFSPFEEYGPAECVPWLRAADEAADQGFPEPVRARVPVNVTIPAVGPAAAERLVATSGGCMTAKVKVADPGQSLAEEVDRVAAVRAVLGPAGSIRVDANGAWDVDTAVERLGALNKAAGSLQYAEQPCATVSELADLRRRTPVPIAADESIRRATDPFLVRDLRAADVVVLKVQPLGGVRACLELAGAIDLPVVVSSAVESAVGIAMGLALAAALPSLDFACGLATGQLLTRDLAPDAFPVHDGAIEARAVSVDEWALTRCAAGPTAQRWWEERLEAVRRREA